MKDFISKIIVIGFLCIIGILLVSCGDDDEDPMNPVTPINRPTITIVEDTENSTYTSIAVKIVPGETAAKFRYALGSAKDQLAFEEGTLNTITTVEGKEPAEVVFDNLETEVVYILYAQSEDKDGNLGDIIEKSFLIEIPWPNVKVRVDALNAVYGTFTTIPNKYSAMYMTTCFTVETYEELLTLTSGNKAQLMNVLYQNDLANLSTTTETESWLMENGYCDDDIVFIVAPIDEDSYFHNEVTEVFLTTPSYNPNLPTPDMKLGAENVTAARGDITVELADGTIGYYFGVLTKSLYQQYANNNLLHTYLLAQGYFQFEGGAFGFNLGANLDLVVVGLPLNENGLDELVEPVIHEFSTPGAGAAYSNMTTIIPHIENAENRNKSRKVITANKVEEIKALLNK